MQDPVHKYKLTTKNQRNTVSSTHTLSPTHTQPLSESPIPHLFCLCSVFSLSWTLFCFLCFVFFTLSIFSPSSLLNLPFMSRAGITAVAVCLSRFSCPLDST